MQIRYYDAFDLYADDVAGICVQLFDSDRLP